MIPVQECSLDIFLLHSLAAVVTLTSLLATESILGAIPFTANYD